MAGAAGRVSSSRARPRAAFASSARAGRLLGASGLIAGLGCALVVQTLPEFLVGDYYWTAFAPPGLLQRGGHISLSLPLFPSVVVLPVLGLLAGIALAVVLGRNGWAPAHPSTE